MLGAVTLFEGVSNRSGLVTKYFHGYFCLNWKIISAKQYPKGKFGNIETLNRLNAFLCKSKETYSVIHLLVVDVLCVFFWDYMLTNLI